MNVRIDRLRLQVPGGDSEAARQFARLVAERLGALLQDAPPASGPARLASRRARVSWPAGADPGGRAAATAAGIARLLHQGTAGQGPAGQETAR